MKITLSFFFLIFNDYIYLDKIYFWAPISNLRFLGGIIVQLSESFLSVNK